MKIRKFYARDMQEGLRKVKKELGSNAVILHSRKVRRQGLKGLFSPRCTEIIAAVDSPPRNEPVLQPPVPEPINQPESGMTEELKEIKSMLHHLIVKEPAEQREAPEKDEFACWRRFLENHDLDPGLIDELLDEICFKNGVGPRGESLVPLLQELVREKFIVGHEKNSRYQVFVGPTGVGKTTTLAKLAARYSFFHKEKVGVITIDHFRIGAIEQLRTYTEIIGLPLEVVMSPGDMREALTRLDGCERILIDTAGRSTGNDQQLDELARYIDQLMPADINLVISATTRRQDIRFISEYFLKLKYNRLIITKLDETSSFGAVLNGCYYAKVPTVYLTDGQRVPDDLQVAEDVDLISLLWGRDKA